MEEEPGSSMEGNFSKTKGIDLQHEWTLWIDVSPPEIFAEERISNYLIKLGSFSTIKKFWMFWNNMDFIFSKIPSTANLRLFRSDKTPYKTNNSSDSKGYWRISLRVDQIRQFWLNMAIAAIGENLEPIDSLVINIFFNYLKCNLLMTIFFNRMELFYALEIRIQNSVCGHL